MSQKMAIPITKKIKLDFGKVSVSERGAAKEEVAEYIVDTILDQVSSQKSPVSGGKFKASLSKNYKKIKMKESGGSKANLELTGDMLDALDARFSGNTLSVGIHKDAGSENMLKAENHNKRTVRARKTSVPERKFIPNKDENFKRNIMRDIKDIIDSYVQDEDD